MIPQQFENCLPLRVLYSPKAAKPEERRYPIVFYGSALHYFSDSMNFSN